MADPHTCACGYTTYICRDEVTDEQWKTFEAFHRMAFDWALTHVSEDRAEAEAFADRYAGELWDDEEACSFSAFYAAEQRRAA